MGGSAAVISRIASITIEGQALGTVAPLTDSFRFMTEKISAFKVGATTFPLTAGLDNPSIGATVDLELFDLA